MKGDLISMEKAKDKTLKKAEQSKEKQSSNTKSLDFTPWFIKSLRI